MATVHKYATPNTVETVLSTELDSLPQFGLAVSAAIDNASDLYKFADFEIYTSQTGDLSTYLSLYLLEAEDGTNYEETPSSPQVNTIPLAAQLIGTAPLENASGFKRHILRGVVLPPRKFKIMLFAGVHAAGLAASGNTVRMIRYNEANV